MIKKMNIVNVNALRQRTRSVAGSLLCIVAMLQCFYISILTASCSSSDGDEGWTAPTEVQPTEPEMAKTPITFGGRSNEQRLCFTATP